MRIAAALFVALSMAACAGREPVATPAPAGDRAAPRAELPPPPAVDGPLSLRVAYPSEGARLAVRDSNFIFGQTGTGRATLTINGAPVMVAPNGAFLAFLPVPADGVYRLSARRDADTAAAELRVEVPEPSPPVPTTATIASVTPAGAWTVRAGEWVEVRVRGTPGAQVAVVLPDGSRVPLVESGTAAEGADPGDDFRPANAAPRTGFALYRGVLAAGRSWQVADTTVPRPRLGAAAARAEAARDSASERQAGAVAAGAERVIHQRVIEARRAQAAAAELAVPRVELVLGTDTARWPLRLNLAVLPPALSLVAVATPPANAPHDWTVRGRIDTSGPFHYFWPPGTRFHVTGERDGYFRVRLAGDLHAYVPAGDVRLLTPGTPPPGAAIAAVRFHATPEYIDLRVPLGERLPFRVEAGEHTLTLDVFGGISRVNFFQYGSLDPLIARALWSQPADSVYRVQVELTRPVWGYQVRFDGSDAMILRIRRPPTIDRARPLAGLRIAIDPGHPPAGAIGPTGLTEAEANLGIALQLRPLLEAAGAHVIMTRTDNRDVELNSRPRMAADSNAHVLVSIHNNAFPDGVNPFTNNGTSVYYFQPHSVDLAQHLQAELLAELGLRDIGIGRADLALVRNPWMPSALSETLYLMVPEQEAAARDPAVQRRIAEAHLRALEAFLRGRAADQR